MTVMLASGGALATPLDLPSLPPDILSDRISVSYDAGTDLLLAEGRALLLDDDGVGASAIITGGMFSLTATIDDAGTASGGSLEIRGSVNGAGPVLLTGSLADFGFPVSGEPLEFLFDSLGGDLASLYGATAGVILTDANFIGSFAADFSNDGLGLADIAVPEPSTLALVLLGGFGLAVAGRRAS